MSGIDADHHVVFVLYSWAVTVRKHPEGLKFDGLSVPLLPE